MSVNGSQEVKAHQSHGWGHGCRSIHLSDFVPVCVFVYVNIVVIGEGTRVFVRRFKMMSGSECSIFGCQCVCIRWGTLCKEMHNVR